MTPETVIVGVVGAGVMGTGLAQALAETGHGVALVDVDESRLEASLAGVRRGLRLSALIQPGGERAELGQVLGRIRPSVDLEAVKIADFVVENVSENVGVKQEVHRRLDEICQESTWIGVNTSAIPITKIGSFAGRPDRVIGMHFMNPVPLKPMVEVIPGYHTSQATIASAKRLLTSMGKECIVVNDSPGFVTNRVMMLTVNEAVFLLHEGVSNAEDVDRLFKTCFGHKMGPLETADLIGVDTILYSLEVLYENLCDDKYRPCPLLRKMVDAGLHGRKSGNGFYDYQPTGRGRE